MSATTISGTAARLRPTSLGGLLVVLASVAVSLASAGRLGTRVRIRWTVGPDYHLGPEYASAPVVLAAFPVAVAALYVGFRRLGRRLERADGFDDARVYYEAAVFGALVALVLVQGALVAANVYS